MRVSGLTKSIRKMLSPIVVCGVLLLALSGCGWSSYREIVSEPIVVETVVVIDAPNLPTPVGPPADSVSIAQAMLPFPCIGFVDETLAIGVDEVREQLPCLISLLPWPEGNVPSPEMLLPAADWPDGTGTEPWLGLIVLTQANQCEWFAAWLDANNAGATTEAEAVLPYLINLLPNYGAVLPGAPDWLSDPASVEVVIEAAEAAANGDPSLVEMYLDGSCR